MPLKKKKKFVKISKTKKNSYKKVKTKKQVSQKNKKIKTKKKNIKKKRSVKDASKRKKYTKKNLPIKTNKVLKSKTKVKVKVKKKKEKKILIFDDYLKKIVTKLIEKHKIDGIYTNKIVEKGIPKRFRAPNNITMVENLLKKNNISILTEKAAKEAKKDIKDTSESNEEGLEDEKKQTGKTDDPVRLYLRDMGTVELLSREGEIAIAKRIEAGREKMIGAICESPMTIRSIINWKESIKEGTMLLRDIVDLEQTYDLSDVGEAKIDDTLKLIEGFKSDNISNEEKKPKKESNEIPEDSENDSEDKDADDEESGLNVSLAAMEEKLKPKVLKDFDEITKLFKKLHKYNQELIESEKRKKKNIYQ